MKKKGPVPHEVFTDRGLQLEKAHQSQQGNSIYTGQTAKDIGEVGQRCSTCGLRIRSPRHAEGMHHKKLVPKCSR
jgi:hypothetical protein